MGVEIARSIPFSQRNDFPFVFSYDTYFLRITFSRNRLRAVVFIIAVISEASQNCPEIFRWISSCSRIVRDVSRDHAVGVDEGGRSCPT